MKLPRKSSIIQLPPGRLLRRLVRPCYDRQMHPPLKIAAISGMVAPLLFGGLLVLLTVSQYRFMLSLGWRPLAAPTFDWPSGLALGPYGLWMTATFVTVGILVVCFSLGLRQIFYDIPAGRRASTLAFVAGVAMACLAFPTDPTIRLTPATLSGRMHDLAFVATGLTLFPAILLFAYTFRRSSQWRNLALYTWLTAALVIPAFILKGIFFYIFLASILVWSEFVAIRLWRIG
jgi:hypothetical protein